MSVVKDASVDSSPNDVDTLPSNVHCASLLGQPDAGDMDTSLAVTTTSPLSALASTVATVVTATTATTTTTSTSANGGDHQYSSNSNDNNNSNKFEANNLPEGVRVLRNVASNVGSISDSIATAEEIKKLKHVQGRSNSTGRLYSSSRRVSFPENDSELVTGYLEPANPWACGMYRR